MQFICFQTSVKLKTTKENLPALARYYFAAKVKNNERSFVICTPPSLGLNMSDCLQALDANARKAGSLRLQIFGIAVLHLDLSGYERASAKKCSLSFLKEKACRKMQWKSGAQPHYFCFEKWPNINKDRSLPHSTSWIGTYRLTALPGLSFLSETCFWLWVPNSSSSAKIVPGCQSGEWHGLTIAQETNGSFNFT